MPLPQYEYKDDLNLKDRLDIVQTYVNLGGYYGLVTELAEDYNTNRQQIYSILEDVGEGLAPKQPGPARLPCGELAPGKTRPQDPSRLLGRIVDLEADNKRLKQKNEQLQIRLQQSVEVTPERLNRFLLTGLGEVLPYAPSALNGQVAVKATGSTDYGRSCIRRRICPKCRFIKQHG